jgi:transposase
LLRVEQYERIRRMVRVEGFSEREVARRLGHSRKTVRKALVHSSPPGYRRKGPVGRPVIDPFRSIIDAWMEEDQGRPRKQRHTARRIWERLCSEYGFGGSASAVRRYVADVGRRCGEVFFPLAFEPGEEAQVDWGDGWVVENGVLKKVHFFCMRLCYSGASFVYPYERMTLEALLDGHVRAFAFFRGVPRRLAYDNLKTVVITVGRGRQRRLTRKFVELRSHYLFSTRFCNVGAAHEKGHVENLVKHVQRTFLTPLPEGTGRADLIAHLMEGCRGDLQRVSGRDRRPIGELLAVERARMLPVPAERFEACRMQSTFADKQGLVRFDKVSYSVPVRYAYHACVVKGFVDRVEIHVPDGCIARHERSDREDEYVLDWRHYVPLLERKPGGLHNGRPFQGEPWGEPLAAMRRELEYRLGGEGTKRFVRILLLFAQYPETQVQQAVHTCVRRGAFSDEAVHSLLAYQPPRRIGHLDLSSRPALAAVGSRPRPASVYGALCAPEVAP